MINKFKGYTPILRNTPLDALIFDHNKKYTFHNFIDKN